MLAIAAAPPPAPRCCTTSLLYRTVAALLRAPVPLPAPLRAATVPAVPCRAAVVKPRPCRAVTHVPPMLVASSLVLLRCSRAAIEFPHPLPASTTLRPNPSFRATSLRSSSGEGPSRDFVSTRLFHVTLTYFGLLMKFRRVLIHLLIVSALQRSSVVSVEPSRVKVTYLFTGVSLV
jgi:hypothetical protein